MAHSKKLIIAGAGGFGEEAAWVAESTDTWDILGFVDDDESKKGTRYFSYPVLGKAADVRESLGPNIDFFCAIGNNQARKRVAAYLEDLGWKPASLIYPNVTIAKNASVGEGSFIGPNSLVAPGAKIGRHVIINTFVGIGHHSDVGDFAQICPGARVNGRCQVKSLAMIGSNATLHPTTVIGEGATVGANSQVIRHVADFTTVVGVPARTVLRRNKP